MSINKNEQVELKIKLQKEINAYLHRSLPLCIILADNRFLPWYYEHFIEIVSYTNNSGGVNIDFLEPEAPYNNILRWICLGYELLTNISSIVDYVREKIMLGYYVIIHLDEYYVPQKSPYNCHYVHQSLVYGYNDSEKHFKVIGFNEKITFTSLTIDYDAFNEAYEKGKIYFKETAPWAANSAIELLKPRDFLVDYPFSIKRFYNKLQNYIYSNGDSSVVYCSKFDKRLISENQIKYGMNVYQDVIRCLENLLKNNVLIDYTDIHLLFEHKAALNKRFQYILLTHNFSQNSIKVFSKYSRIVDEFKLFRFQFLKFNSLFSAANQINENSARIIEQLMDFINSVSNEEYSILRDISHEIELLTTS
ncbi:MAG: hypothetical protein K6U80_16980 [Firmicutes bacterium]|nr:hypothetical protein [Bacillota bacterium]